MALFRANQLLPVRQLLPRISAMSYTQDSGHFSGLGKGAGKGGGGGGSIREAGGAFGQLEAAREEEYFYKLQKMQLKGLRDQLEKEVDFHDQHLKHHLEAVERHKKRIAELHREEKELEPKK